jgi:anti-sigma regulatory factor (Ser/Thr protein kinase)
VVDELSALFSCRYSTGQQAGECREHVATRSRWKADWVDHKPGPQRQPRIERAPCDIGTGNDGLVQEAQRKLGADGLKATIEQYARGFAARTSLKVVTGITPEVDRLPYKKQRSLLRIIQEALANVFRHAKATDVEVAIGATESHFRLRVRDHGRGMASARVRYGASEPSLGVGLPAMRARLQQLGGTLEIRSSVARSSGTTLSAVFPHHLASNRRSRRKGLVIIKGGREHVTK